MQIRGKRLALYFVIKEEYRNENDVSDEMQLAYMVCIKHWFHELSFIDNT